MVHVVPGPVMQDRETAEKSGLTVESLGLAMSRFQGQEPILQVGNRMYLHAVRVCQQAYGTNFRDVLGIAIVGHNKYKWDLIDSRTL